MQWRASPSGVEIWTPAKLNLFLEVLAKRADGFHEIDTLMVPIDLYDTLYFREERDERIELACHWASQAAVPAVGESFELPQGSRNIAVRALELLREAHGVRAGAKLRLIKRIPIGAGLAGGSSDAAAVLVAANIAWRLGLSAAELSAVASQVGSDVPFFIGSSAARCTGRGELIEPLAGIGRLHFVVVYPPAGLATPDVYKACSPGLPARRADELVAAFRAGRYAAAGRLLHNRLEPAAAKLSPWIDRLRGEFTRQDVLGAQMSGSGASYFGLCRSALHARRVANRLRMRGVGQVYAAASCHRFRL